MRKGKSLRKKAYGSAAGMLSDWPGRAKQSGRRQACYPTPGKESSLETRQLHNDHKSSAALVAKAFGTVAPRNRARMHSATRYGRLYFGRLRFHHQARP
jgi:hypothetical protein